MSKFQLFLLFSAYFWAFYPNFTVFFLVSCMWPLTPPATVCTIPRWQWPQYDLMVLGAYWSRNLNAMGQWPYCPSRMEASYCIFGFGANIRRNLRTLSLQRDSPHNNHYVCVISPRRKGNSRLLGGLSYEKILRYANSPPCVTARWQPQQIPSLNFLGIGTFRLCLCTRVIH